MRWYISLLLIPFRSGRNGRNFSCRHEARNRKPPRSTSGQISGCFGPFRPFRPIPANFGRYVILSKKKKKRPNDAVLDLTKNLTQTLFLSFFHSYFHSQILTAVVLVPLPSCSLPLLCSLNHSTLSYSAVSNSLTVSLSQIEQPRYSFSTLTLSNSSFSSASAKSFFFSYDLLCG